MRHADAGEASGAEPSRVHVSKAEESKGLGTLQKTHKIDQRQTQNEDTERRHGHGNERKGASHDARTTHVRQKSGRTLEIDGGRMGFHNLPTAGSLCRLALRYNANTRGTIRTLNPFFIGTSESPTGRSRVTVPTNEKPPHRAS